MEGNEGAEIKPKPSRRPASETAGRAAAAVVEKAGPAFFSIATGGLAAGAGVAHGAVRFGLAVGAVVIGGVGVYFTGRESNNHRALQFERDEALAAAERVGNEAIAQVAEAQEQVKAARRKSGEVLRKMTELTLDSRRFGSAGGVVG